MGMSSPISAAPVDMMTPASRDNFIPYQPDGPTPGPPATTGSVTEQQQQQQGQEIQKPLQWLPPNVCATPVQSPAKRGDLPVFSSTGVIPFGPRPTTQGQARGGDAEVSSGDGVGGGEGGDRREVPESPH